MTLTVSAKAFDRLRAIAATVVFRPYGAARGSTQPAFPGRHIRDKHLAFALGSCRR